MAAERDKLIHESDRLYQVNKALKNYLAVFNYTKGAASNMLHSEKKAWGILADLLQSPYTPDAEPDLGENYSLLLDEDIV